MVDIGFSEFTYGYAFLSEMTNRYQGYMLGAPVLPNLRCESRLGYDAYIPTRGIDFYYQFKKSDYLYRRSAKYRRDNTYTAPYYLFEVNNSQHNMLFRLARQKKYVYYADPRLNNIDKFNDAYLDGLVVSNSIQVPVRSCGYIGDRDAHCVTFPGVGGRQWRFHSETKEFDNAITGEVFKEAIEETKKDWKNIDRAFAEELFYGLYDLAIKEYKSKKELDRLLEEKFFKYVPRKYRELAMAGEISLVCFGANLVLVGE